MSLFINLFVLLANLIAFFAIYHSFGKRMKKDKKIKTTLIIIGAMYIITLIVYLLSGIGVEKVQKNESFRTYLMMVFVPVNIIIIIPYSVYSFMQTQEKKISKEKLNKRLLIVEIVAIVILIIEFFYFRSSQKNLKELSDELSYNEVIVENNMQNNIIEENNVEINDINIE